MRKEIHFDYKSRIEEICEERGISKYKLWQMSGACKSTFYNLTKGTTLAPNTNLIYSICDAVDMDISTFFNDSDKKTEIPASRKEFVYEICTMDDSEFNRLKGYLDSIREQKQ